MEATENALAKKSNEELFFFFKHDGSIDFPKKLAAGKILYNRKYDRRKLAEEKKKITDELNKEIEICINPEKIKREHKAQLKKNLIWSLILTIVVATITIINSNQLVSSILTELAMISASIIAMPFIRYLWGNRSLQKKLREGKRNLQVLESRLEIIEQEWPF